LTRADELHRVTPELAVWQAYEPAVKCELTSCALRFGGALVLVDPIALGPEAIEELTAWARPALILCTNANHARAADWWRARFAIPVAAHVEAAGLETVADLALEASHPLLAALEFVPLPGAAPGEVAIYDPRGVLCMGDALIHLPPLGLAILPDKYCADAKLLRVSLGKLLRLPSFATLTFAHGLPLTVHARSRLEDLLA
jgi:glyoxylase-like metal-dependent hydrolase (beta-lactamase superfamily II)